MVKFSNLRYDGVIDTAHEFAKSDYAWAGTHAGAWIDSIKEDTEVKNYS